MLYLAARATRLPALVAGVRWATLPGVRRVVDGVVAASVVGSAVVGNAAAAAPAALAYVPHAAGDRDDLASPPPVVAAPGPVVGPAPAGPAPAPAAPPGDSARSGGATHEVVRGENLWSIAEAHLAAELQRPAASLGTDEVRPYWVRVVRENRSRLASGDPDVIFPGERVVPPAVRPGGT